MKKEYQKPIAEYLRFDFLDTITAGESGGGNIGGSSGFGEWEGEED